MSFDEGRSMFTAPARAVWRGVLLAALAGLLAPQVAEARTHHSRHQADVKKPAKTPAKGSIKSATKANAAERKRHKAPAAPSAKSTKMEKQVAADTRAPSSDKRKGGPLYAVVIGPGPSWKKGQPLRASKSDGHYRYWQDLQSKGLIESAGPVGKDTGFVLLHARNQREANALLAADPAIRDGRFRAVARPYAQTLGGGGD
ncbi:MAG: hypothetical protein JSR28_06845 [Proteobacteria bacterium]|nr:hypothetical protein [Pseudomonadota bacterium]